MFNCDKCGLCCQNVGNSLLYAALDRGDGICRHYDEGTKLCRIYDQRPVICNVDEAYERFFKDQMDKTAYYEINYAACNRLKEKNRG